MMGMQTNNKQSGKEASNGPKFLFLFEHREIRRRNCVQVSKEGALISNSTRMSVVRMGRKWRFPRRGLQV